MVTRNFYPCFTAVKITKTSQEARTFFEADFLLVFWDFVSSLLKYKKFFKFGTKAFHSPKYKLFQSGFFLLFELAKLLPEI